MGKNSFDLFGTPERPRAVPVMVPLPVPRPYSYMVPDGMHVEPGAIVQVPLGPRQVFGVVWDGGRRRRRSEEAEADHGMPSNARRLPGDAGFLDWVAAYTLSPPGLVARMALRAPAAFDPEPMVEGLRLDGRRPERMTPAGRGCDARLPRRRRSWTRQRPRACGRCFDDRSSMG